MSVHKAIESLLENKLDDMRQNLVHSLNEKAVEKLEERKKEIASSYFAQGK